MTGIPGRGTHGVVMTRGRRRLVSAVPAKVARPVVGSVSSGWLGCPRFSVPYTNTSQSDMAEEARTGAAVYPAW